MCAYPTKNFQTCYRKHTYSFIWPDNWFAVGYKDKSKVVVQY